LKAAWLAADSDDAQLSRINQICILTGQRRSEADLRWRKPDCQLRAFKSDIRHPPYDPQCGHWSRLAQATTNGVPVRPKRADDSCPKMDYSTVPLR
jgi:hypothetical protein